MRIGIAFDLVPADRTGPGPDDRFEEFDKPETVDAIAAVLRGEGHDVVLLGDGRAFLEKVLADPPDLVWNMAEGEGVGRSREARVPAALEMLEIPYTGSDPLTLAAALDKEVARRLVRDGIVRVPAAIVCRPDLPAATVEGNVRRIFRDEDAYPLILKPCFEGSSKGIRGDCLARNASEAASIHQRLARDYQQPILIEQFIDGDEVTVGLVGNGLEVEVIGSMRVVPKRSGGPFVYSLEVKRDWARRVNYEAPAPLPDEVMGRLVRAARSAFLGLGCRDLARIDFRVKDGMPYFIEANPLPGLAPGTSDLVILAQGYGIDHGNLIRRILSVALDRIGQAGMSASPRKWPPRGVGGTDIPACPTLDLDESTDRSRVAS